MLDALGGGVVEQCCVVRPPCCCLMGMDAEYRVDLDVKVHCSSAMGGCTVPSDVVPSATLKCAGFKVHSCRAIRSNLLGNCSGDGIMALDGTSGPVEAELIVAKISCVTTPKTVTT